MVDRVDADEAGLLLREPGHEGRVVDRPGRVDAVEGDDRLLLGFRNRQHGETVDFGAGAVREVHRDDRQRTLRRKALREEFARGFAGVTQQDRRAFPGVDRAAAADGDDGLGPDALAESGRFVGLHRGRVRGHAVVQRVADFTAVQDFFDHLPRAGALVGAAAGDDQDARDSAGGELVGDIGEILNRADSEIKVGPCPDDPDAVDVNAVFPHDIPPQCETVPLRQAFFTSVRATGPDNANVAPSDEMSNRFRHKR